jgi:hypothetical protein
MPDIRVTASKLDKDNEIAPSLPSYGGWTVRDSDNPLTINDFHQSPEHVPAEGVGATGQQYSFRKS